MIVYGQKVGVASCLDIKRYWKNDPEHKCLDIFCSISHNAILSSYLDTSHVVPNRKPTVAGNGPEYYEWEGSKISILLSIFLENILKLPFFLVRLYTRADPKPIRTNQINTTTYKES